MKAKVFMVDAFTRNPFEGNPCSVMFTTEYLPLKTRQRVAKQTNTVVTCFLSWRECLNNTYSFDIRYETPVSSLELCGHATLAASKVIYDEYMIPHDQNIDLYYTENEKLTAKYCNEFDISINMPQLPLKQLELNSVDGTVLHAICTSLNIDSSDVVYFGRNIYDYVVQVKTAAVVRACSPNFVSLKEVDTRATILTSSSDDDQYDTITRVFLPRVGIDEDNVCGSAHCGIAKHYSDSLKKCKLSCYEPSSRPGSLMITILDEGRLMLQASCHITFGPSVVVLPADCLEDK